MKKLFNQDEFSKRVREKMFKQMLNEERKIGLRRFASDIGISTATLSRLTNGKTPDVETFFKICVWLDTTPVTFIEEPFNNLES